jgi:hypothetical protein
MSHKIAHLSLGFAGERSVCGGERAADARSQPYMIKRLGK